MNDGVWHEFSVVGMQCGGCVKAVTGALQALEPGAEVAVELDAGRVRVKGAKGVDAYRAAIEAAGFDATAA
jgi:copper chaperone